MIGENGSYSKLLVLGLGNPYYRDDFVGLKVHDMAKQKIEEQHRGGCVEFKALCAGGLDLLFEVEGFDALIVSDSFKSNDGIPGRVRTLFGEDLTAAGISAYSTHLMGLPDAIRLGARLDLKMPKRICAVVIDIDDRGLDFGEGLTPEVEKAVPVAAAELIHRTLEFLEMNSVA